MYLQINKSLNPHEGAFLLKNMKKYLVFLATTLIFSWPANISVVSAASHPVSTIGILEPVNLENMIQNTKKVLVTAYTSTPEETDSTPFITASGKKVRDGIVATNILPLGTKITIPSIFGDKIFVVEDRMNRRMKYVVDVWMSSKNKAIRFGVQRAEITVLD